MGEIALRSLRGQWRALLGWVVATVALVAVVLAFWPSISGDSALSDSFSDLPPAVQAASGIADLGTPAGYLQGQIFSTLGPLILISFGVGRGARAIAGEEDAGTMDLLLATPVRRSRVVAEKAAAMLAGLLLIGLCTWLTLVIVAPLADADLSASKLLAATVSLVGAGALYGGIALGLSAATGQRALSLGISAGLAGAAFIYTSVAPYAGSLADHQDLSPMQWTYGYEPLVHGLDWGKLALLIGFGVLFAVAGAVRFDRRDVRA